MEMSKILNRPRVFLSHSKLDVNFIEKLADDLRRCQIEPWLDSDEIRHGKPWLESIFENGIPTCDCVMLYFTDNSLSSSMVRKEMDAALIHKLNDGGVAFLPYVSSEKVRSQLRIDIQSLQAPVWGAENYRDLLPRVVAEIWRSFMERTVKSAVQNEQIKRLQAELELQKIQQVQTKVFSDGECADFAYIWNSFDKDTVLDVRTKSNSGESESLVSFKISCHQVISQLTDVNVSEYNFSWLVDYLTNLARAKYIVDFGFESKDFFVEPYMDDFKDSLLMFGLVESHFIPPAPTQANNSSARSQWLLRDNGRTILLYTPKMHRLRYWLAHNNLLEKTLDITKV
ncbi:toll/interleukin-1 receptor domain-containing protein [Geomesophilobacter sediminis]|uniref:Toll/interleukin-1 receptor domain-containing protein n=1 Tax=Geomesophilobacter sediminis TaxID=2798584 RepID=A0A8J7IPB8_9BACT|nr:toll/interleukin-1 receptor domain-containing protein [Geomesophilobacter sediminis]MBJ6724159.1 toll/interleukin-1 receptor domain-containing protein [Geomesophilobacter sediminis]